MTTTEIRPLTPGYDLGHNLPKLASQSTFHPYFEPVNATDRAVSRPFLGYGNALVQIGPAEWRSVTVSGVWKVIQGRSRR